MTTRPASLIALHALASLLIAGCTSGFPLDDPDAGLSPDADPDSVDVGCVGPGCAAPDVSADVDEGKEDRPCEIQLWYPDLDGDGHGDPGAAPQSACEPPAGFSTLADDCDDGDPGAHPGAAELTGDGVDSDCDGLELCFLDADADGIRPAGDTLVMSDDGDCDDPGEAGTASPTGDCNDRDPRSPSAEVCDGIDNDCDGVIDQDAGCPCALRHREGGAYLFCISGRQWAQASADCNAFGYHLAVIDGAEENLWIAAELDRDGTEKAWIGLTDTAQEGVFVWVDGTPLSFSAWSGSNPDGGQGESCVELMGDHGDQGRWNDKECDEGRRFVCEREP